MNWPKTEYCLKYDALRTRNHWSVIGPFGRVTEAATEQEALGILRKELGTEVRLGRQFTPHFGHVWEVEPVESVCP